MSTAATSCCYGGGSTSAPVLRLVLPIVAVLVPAWSDVASGRRPPPPACDTARYILERALTADQPAVPGVTAGATAIAIDGLCDPTAPLKYKGARRGTLVKVRWPECTGVDGQIRFRGRILDDCGRIRGKLRAKGFKGRVRAVRSVCGDRIVDEAAGESCDPPEVGGCSATCQLGVTAIVGPNGGMIGSADGRLLLDIPPGALAGDTAVSVRRLAPEELPAALAAEGFTPVYALSPAGLQFQVPVTLTWRMDVPPLVSPRSFEADVGLLLTLGRDGETLEPLANPRTTVDLAGNLVLASGTLEHFTFAFEFNSRGLSAAGKRNAFVKGVLDPGLTVPVDGLLTVDITYQAGRDVISVTGNAVHVNQSDDNENADSDVVEYDPFGNKDDETPLGPIATAGDTAGASILYLCKAPGTWSYAAEVQLQRGNQLLQVLGRDVVTEMTVDIQPQTIMCVVTTTSTSVTSTSVTTSTSSTSSSTSTSTSTTSTSTSSTTSTSLMPCTLIQPDPDPVTNPFPDPLCSGFCPVDQVCVFSVAEGGCACQPSGAECRDQDPAPGNAVCGGLCANPDASCVATGDGVCNCDDPCFGVFVPPSPEEPIGHFECREVGTCPDGKVCDLELCRCIPAPTTTSTSVTSTTSTSTSSTSSTTSSSVSTTATTALTTSTTLETTTTSNTTTTTSSSTTTTMQLIGGRAVVLDFQTGTLPAGTLLCLDRVLGGCVAAEEACPADHLHRGIGVVSQGQQRFPDMNQPECGQGEILASVPGCGADVVPPCPVVGNTAFADLTSDQVVPPSGSTFFGSCSGGLSSDTEAFFLSCSTNALGITEAHVHHGAAGANGPVVHVLDVDNGTVFGSTSIDPAQVAAFRQGSYYVDVHTGAFPAGALRGQLRADQTFNFPLDGAQEVPPVATAASGSCSGIMNAFRTQYDLTCEHDLADPLAGHVHQGARGEEGDPFITFSNSTSPIEEVFSLTPEVADDVLAGNLYVNVHTAAHPDGELRGQIERPTYHFSWLAGDQAVPPVTTSSSGTCTAVLRSDASMFTLSCEHDVPAPQVTGAEIGMGAPGVAGSQVFDLGDGQSPISATFGVDPSGAFVQALRAAELYVNVHTAGNPSGEIRGQLVE